MRGREYGCGGGGQGNCLRLTERAYVSDGLLQYGAKIHASLGGEVGEEAHAFVPITGTSRSSRKMEW
jgi:hypothetical protein